MAAGEKKKKPAAAPKKPPPPKSDAYLQLSPWLPATVCLRSAQHQWAVCRDEVERKAREENQKVVKERREKACEYAHTLLQYGADLWRDDVEQNESLQAVPQTYIWLTPECAAALRRTARQGTHAKDLDIFVDEILTDMPATYEFMAKKMASARELLPRLQSLGRGFICRRKIRRWLLTKFEQRAKGNNKYYIDLDVEKEQKAHSPVGKKKKASFTSKRNPHPLTWKRPPLMLKREPNLGTMENMKRRLQNEEEKAKRRLQKDTLHRKANEAKRKLRDERSEALYELGKLRDALENAHRYLGRKLSQPRYRKEPPPQKSEDEPYVTEEMRLRKQKEHQIIFNRYDVDRGGTVDAGELDVIFRDMKRVLPQEQINDLIFEYAVKDEERDEVYFDEFCNMLDALEEREKAQKKEREAQAIREALKHHACCSLLPCATLDDSAQSDALRLLDDALLARLEEPSSSESEDDEGIKWDAPVSTCFLEKTTDDKAKEKLARQKRKEAREKLKEQKEMNRGGRDTLQQRKAKNDQLQLFRESQFKALSYYKAEDVLRLILKSETVKHALEDGLRIYQQETAWPLRECFPLPFLVEKRVDCLDLAQRYVATIDSEGTLCAVSQYDSSVQHGPEWLARMETTVNDLTEVFEKTKGAWLAIFQNFDRRRAVERARLDKPDEGVGEAIIRIAEPNETSKKKATRHRDAFIKYNEGGRVDVDGLEQVFVDMKLTVPDSEDLSDTIEHYSKGGEGVNHEQFSELLDLLESDEGYKLRKVYDKYLMRLWSVKGGDRRTTLNGEALGLLFGDLRVEHYFTSEKIEALLVEGELSFEQFQATVESLKGLRVKRAVVRCSLRSFTKEDTVPYVKLFGTDALFDSGKVREPMHMRAQYAFQKLAGDRDSLNVKELCVAFDQLGFDLSMIDVERLCDGSETKYEDFLGMLESLPAVHEVPSVHRRVRGFVDEVCSQLGEICDERDRFLPPAPDVLVVDFFLDTIDAQIDREQRLREAGLNPMMPPVPKPTPYVCSVVPLSFKHGKEKVPKPHLGLFEHAKKDDRKQLAGIRVPPRKSSRSRPSSRQNDDGPQKDDPSEYGWKEADPSGVVRYRRKLGEGRVFEFRAREGLRTGKALTEAMDPGAWDGRFM
ncbi:unnamed protein product [Pelagomonas calceolata]|uniref:EF-hand domain-containing protein n=1 Tax=Pelagomonas calceolata TaxID=35677 RepID=A0A7S3ZJF5_9STRA|nr:unnamed protein product [Pelagomonas calceolata]